jgi:hypothetical protein
MKAFYPDRTGFESRFVMASRGMAGQRMRLVCKF